MYSPFNSRHFTMQIDAQSGMRYAVLSTRVAPVQQGFYFVNSGFSDDGRYLWFYCAFPPAANHSLAVIDFLTDEIHHYPETAGSGYMIDPLTGNAYWGCAQGIFMRTPHPQDAPVCVAPIPEMCRKAAVRSAGTHLTFTPDRTEILADMQTPLGSVIGTFSVVTGEFTKWYQTQPGVPYNHAQLSPTDPNLCMCAHEYSYDPIKGESVPPPMTEDGIYPRLQIIGRDGSRRMLPPLGNYATHEWWAPDGKSVYYCNNGAGSGGVIARDKLDGSAPELVCEIPIEKGVGTWHAHCTKDQRYFVADGSYYCMGLSWWRGCESTVRFYDTHTKKLVTLVTLNPVVMGWSPQRPCTYHIDPHPRFVVNDTMITFTTTTQGKVDLAVAETKQLMDATNR